MASTSDGSGSSGSDRPRDPARDVARATLLAELAALGINLAILLAITKRDALRRVWLRYRWYVLREWRHADEERMVAELQSDISRYEHQQRSQGGGGGRGGLYGGLR